MNCAIPECERSAAHRGWCSMHYQRWRNHGDPTVTLKKGPPVGRPTKHGQCINFTISSTYRIWQQMHQRCANPKSNAYDRYGGRGISVCERWQDFSSFLLDMGERPAKLQIERIDNDGNYEPANCRWATHVEQMQNMCRNVLTLEKARAIHEKRAAGASVKTISTEMNIKVPTIYGVLNGYTWRETMKRNQGFTLLETMIVVAIIGILAAIALPAYQDYVIRSKMAEPLAAIAACKTAVTEYASVKAAYPADATVAGCSNTPTNFTESLTVTDGVITATSKGTGAKPAECVLTLSPPAGGATNIDKWTGSFSGCAAKYVPSSFR